MSDAIEYQCLPDIPDDLLAHYLAQEAVAVDTELHGLTLYRDEICLVQLCDDAGRVCLVKPDLDNPPPNLAKLMTAPGVVKVFHFALTDVAFFKTSLGVDVAPFHCTKVMSKVARTFTEGHGLKDLCKNLLGFEMEKEMQQTDWSRTDLTSGQLKYAANDVLHLLKIYRILEGMIQNRRPLSTGATLVELNEKAQAVLPNLATLLVHGYGDKDRGWETTLFSH